MVYPSLDMKETMLKRMKERGNDEKFIEFQNKHYDEFVTEIIEECDKFSGTGYCGGHYTPNACLRLPLTNEKPYITTELIDECLDNSMGNLSCLWWNY